MNFDISLQQGWNAISLPLTPELPLAKDVLAPVLPYIDVMYYLAANSWIQVLGDTELKPGIGYFIYMKSPQTLTLSGTPVDKVPPLHVYPVGGKPGYWSVGAPYDGIIINDIIAPSLGYGSPELVANRIAFYTGLTSPTKMLGRYDRLEPGKGYWLGTNVDTYFAATNTLLTLDIIDANGNSITEAWVDDTIYAVGTLTDTDGILINNEDVILLLNGETTGLSAITVNGKYRIPYTITTLTTKIFKTKYRGTIV